MTRELLRISDLSTRYFTQDGQVNAVSNLDLRIGSGEVFGIVGESGSGKSVTARSIVDLIDPPGRITDGELWYRNEGLADAVSDKHEGAVDGSFVDLRAVPERIRASLRGTAFSMIFQDPESSFNPSLTVGEQIAEAAEVTRRASASAQSTWDRADTTEYSLSSYALSTVLSSKRYVSPESHDRAVELLELVGIPDPARRADQYPHEYSGGMLQRAMIAQAIAGEPDVLIADEPTTALDVTIQAQVLTLLADLQAETGMTILLITHDLGVIARMCDRVGVMYAGEIVERGTLEDVFDEQVHPYTKGLLGSVPELDATGGALTPIEGSVPSLLDVEIGDRCHFADRCPKAMDACLSHPPEYDADGSEEHTARCVLATREYDERDALSSEYFAEHDGETTLTGTEE